MTKVDIKDVTGKSSGSVELTSSIFGIEPNLTVMHQVVRAQRAAWRQGTSNTLTRGKVRGGGRKPFRQKGTGRARQGTIRAPQYPGGGVVFGPHPRSYSFKVNRKEIKLAIKSALSAKALEGNLIVVNAFDFDVPSTKRAIEVLEALDLSNKRVTVFIADDDVNTYLSFRNIQAVNVVTASDVNTYDVIDSKAVVVTMDALRRIEEVLA